MSTRSRAFVGAVVAVGGVIIIGLVSMTARRRPHDEQRVSATVEPSEEQQQPGPRAARVAPPPRVLPPKFKTDDRALAALVNARTEGDVSEAEAARLRAAVGTHEGRPEAVYAALNLTPPQIEQAKQVIKIEREEFVELREKLRAHQLDQDAFRAGLKEIGKRKDANLLPVIGADKVAEWNAYQLKAVEGMQKK